MISVQFTYLIGLKRSYFHNARLAGSWNGWVETPMTAIVAEDGCPAFTKTIEFDDSHKGPNNPRKTRGKRPIPPKALQNPVQYLPKRPRLTPICKC